MKSSDATTTQSAPLHATPMGRLCSVLLLGGMVGCIVAIGAGAFLGGRFALDQVSLDRRAMAQSVATQVTTALEPLLKADELSAARRVIAELGRMPGVVRCTLSLPDGRTVADSVVREIEVPTLPATWRGPVDPAQIATDSGNASFILQTIDVDHRGQLFLRITTMPQAAAFGVAEYSAFGLVTVAALLGMLLACQRLRSRIAGISLVGEALHCLATGDEPIDQLRLDQTLGREAADWNRVLDQFGSLKRDERAVAVRSLLNGPAASVGRGEGSSNGNSSSSELHAAIDLLPTGVLLLDDACRVRTANGAGAALLGLDRTTILGVDCRTIINGPAFSEAVHATQRGSERRTIEIDRTSENGGILRVNVRPLRREDQGGALLTIEDVTQQRIADASRNQFVAQATHELRAPLTNMRLCLESALDDDAHDLDAVTRHLNVLNDETRRLERLVSEMLSVAEIEAGSLALKSDDVKLDRVFDELRADYTGSCAEKSLTLAFELPPKFPLLRGDRDKLMAAFHNLLSNAVKYTPNGGRLIVAARQESDRFIIDITDTGYGIPPDDQPRIFERFFRSRDPRIAKITGTGLGLALSREVARLHGGELSFKSEFNRGTTFTLSLPVALQPA